MPLHPEAGRQVEDCLAIALDSHAGDGLEAGLTNVGDLPEVLAVLDVRNVDLDAGDGDCLEGVKNCNRGVRVGGGVHDDAVVRPKGGLDLVDDCALVVALIALDIPKAGFCGGCLASAHQGGVVSLSIDVRLANAKHIDVRAVNHKERVNTGYLGR